MRIIFTSIFSIIIIASAFGQSRDNLLKVKENDKWGLYDFLTSKVVIEPEYDRIGQRSAWGIKITKDNKIGMVSNKGELICKPQFKDIYGYSPEVYRVTLLDDSKNVVDVATGEIILPVGDYDEITPISKEYFIIHKDGTTRLMNKFGKYTSGLTHKFRYVQDLSLLVSTLLQKYSLCLGIAPFFAPSTN